MNCRDPCCVSWFEKQECATSITIALFRSSYYDKGYSLADKTLLFPRTELILSIFLYTWLATDTRQFHAKGRVHILCWLSVGEVDISDERAFTNT